MEIRFGVYFTRSLGTLYKDNEIDVEGREAKVDIDLNEVNSLTVEFKIGEASFTDYVTIKDVENGLIQIPFKNDVFKAGLNSFEIVALMKNGDVKASQTYTYYIEKSLENPNSVEAETNYPILVTLVNNVQNALNAEAIRVLNEEERQVLKGQVELLKTNLESLQTDLNALEDTIETNENTRQVNEEARQTLKDSMSTLKSSLEILQTDLNTLEDNVETNESTRQSNEADRGTTFTGKINEIDNKIVEATTAITNTNIAKTNTEVATNNANTKITETEATRQSIITTINNLVAQFNALAPTSSTNAEVQLARTDVAGKTYASLQERLLADNKQQNILYSSVAGTYVTSDSVDGYAKNVVIEGNTYQNPALLSDIRSTGTKLADGRYEIPLLCVGKNLFDNSTLTIQKAHLIENGTLTTNVKRCTTLNYMTIQSQKDYVVSLHNEWNIPWILFYDKNKNFLSYVSGATKKFTSPSNAKYVVLDFTRNDVADITSTHIQSFWCQLEEGTVATSFEQNQTHKLTILSDCQIEKVGTVADRIVQLADGKWYIEKNIKTITLNGSETWSLNTTATNTIAFYTQMYTDVKPNITPIMDRFKQNSSYMVDEEGTFSSSSIALYINISKTKATDVATHKTWLSQNNTLVKYPTTTPVYIPLPDDQRVALRTFTNKTNILTLCEIEPTIKGDVPKSTSASINSIALKLDNVDSELEKIKKLEDATTSTVVCDKDFVNISDTGNGYLSDLKLEGRSLVNLFDINKITPTNVTKTGSGYFKLANVATAYDALVPKGNITLKPNMQYTFIFDIKTYTLNKSVSITGSSSTPFVINKSLIQGVTGIQQVVLTTKADFSSASYDLAISHNITDTTGDFECRLMIVEGDCTQNPPIGYFEGLKSVGQDVNKIVVSSVKGDGNLFDGKFIKGFYSTSNGLYNNVNYSICNEKLIPVIGGSSLYIKYNKSVSIPATVSDVILEYDINKNFIGIKAIASNNCSIALSNNTKFINFRFYTSDTTFVYPIDCVNNLILSYKDITYRPIETDKKEILYLDTVDSTWKKPTFRGLWSNGSLVVGDVVEKKSDGKYSYRKRMSEVVLNGSEDWQFPNLAPNVNTQYFYVNAVASNNTSLGNHVTDKFSTAKYGDIGANDIEGLATGGSGVVRIRISKSKLVTQDLAGFKAWLQANPVTVVYELATPLIYECTPIDLSSFDNETNYYVESGVLSPRSTIKVANYIGNIINNLKEKVSIQENQNNLMRITLLNHEARLILGGH